MRDNNFLGSPSENWPGGWNWSNGYSGAFEIYAILGKGRHHKLLSGLDAEQALFLEQEIERYLGIEDYPVRGEYGR